MTLRIKLENTELINNSPPITFPYNLDIFQKNAINSIEENNNVLVTAHTSAGKSTVAEYAIAKALSLNKKVIYTSPIKTLSNQKYCDFCKMYDSVGILTGDIKQNPDADILVMTTEILRNMLFRSNELIDELFCVIFDEVHYINDIDRGHVWEETILMLPKKIILVMLSATIENPEKFADWLLLKNKNVDLVGTKFRPVPLSHNLYFDNKIINIMGNDKNFNSKLYSDMQTELNKYYKKYISPHSLINEMVSKLQEKEYFPCIFFCYSRKKCETYANMINKVLVNHEEVRDITNIINKYLKGIFKNYERLAQTQQLLKVLSKGIGYHHSGLVHPLKEIQEILFSKGLIKILFATETFSVGVNMPTRSVVFTELTKYDGIKNDFRYLNTSEYLQMAGRAGRRGKDSEGTVIYLPMKEPPICTDLKKILTGNSTKINSRLKLNTQFLLKVIQSKEFNVNDFVNKSLLGNENIDNMSLLKDEYKKLKDNIDNMQIDKLNNIEDVNKIIRLEKELTGARANRKRKIEGQIKNMLKDNKIANSLNIKKSYLSKLDRLNELDQMINRNTLLLELNLSKKFLIDLGFINKSTKEIIDLSQEDLSKKGFMATEVNECNEILLVEMIDQGYFDDLNICEIFGLLAVFLTDKMEEEIIISDLDITDIMKVRIREIGDLNIKIDEIALNYRLNYNAYLTLTFVVPAYMWAKGIDFKEIYEKNSIEMYEGNFVKNIMKILNICNEIVNVCEMIGKTELIEKMENIESLILRDIVSFDSIYLLN